MTVGHGLESYNNQKFEPSDTIIATTAACRLGDTPGFGDTYKSDIEILAMVAEWLVKRSVYYGERLVYYDTDPTTAIKGNINLATSSTCIGFR